MKILVIKFYHSYFPPKALHDLFFMHSTEPDSHEQYLLILTLYYMLETISVHVSFEKLFPWKPKPGKLKQGKDGRKIFEYTTRTRDLHSKKKGGGEGCKIEGAGVESFVIEYFNKITFFGEMAMLYASVSFFWGNLLL